MAALLFSAGRTYADGDAAPDWRLGAWTGATQGKNGRTIAVTLAADPKKTDRATVQFGNPWTCLITLAVASQDDKAVVFGIKSTTGGRCDNYIEGSAQLRQVKSKDTLALTFNGRLASDKLELYLRRCDTAPKAAPQPPKPGTTKNNKAN